MRGIKSYYIENSFSFSIILRNTINLFYFRRFRSGFKQVFSWVPCVNFVEETSGLALNAYETRIREPATRYSMTGSPEMHARINRNGQY